VAAAAAAAFDIFAGLEIFHLNFRLLLFLVFHFGSPVCLFWFSELLFAPNNTFFPPVTVFLGIRSSTRMHEAFFPLGLFAANVLPTVFVLWSTRLS